MSSTSSQTTAKQPQTIISSEESERRLIKEASVFFQRTIERYEEAQPLRLFTLLDRTLNDAFSSAFTFERVRRNDAFTLSGSRRVETYGSPSSYFADNWSSANDHHEEAQTRDRSPDNSRLTQGLSSLYSVFQEGTLSSASLTVLTVTETLLIHCYNIIDRRLNGKSSPSFPQGLLDPNVGIAVFLYKEGSLFGCSSTFIVTRLSTIIETVVLQAAGLMVRKGQENIQQRRLKREEFEFVSIRIVLMKDIKQLPLCFDLNIGQSWLGYTGTLNNQPFTVLLPDDQQNGLQKMKILELLAKQLGTLRSSIYVFYKTYPLKSFPGAVQQMSYDTYIEVRNR